MKLVAEADDVPWYCIPCLILENAENFPFGFLSKTQLCELYGNDSPSQVDTLPSFEILSKLNNIPSLNSFDIDENFVHTIDFKYYRVQDLPKSTDHKANFSLFHANIRSLSKHFDKLQSLLFATKIPFDIIGLTGCGGIAMYIRKSSDLSVLSKFNATEDEYEALWIEINTGPKSRNIICCCAYRHPDTDASKFLEYMESIVSKFENKNKLIFVFRKKDGSVRYTHIKLTRAKGYFTHDINGGGDNMFTADSICEMIEFLIDNIFVRFGGRLFRQVIGIPVGTNCAPLLADLFLYSYENEFLDNMIRSGHRRLARSFNLCYRYIDDLIVFNNKTFLDYLKEIYPSQLTVEKANKSDHLADYLDLTFIIDSGGKLSTRLYDKRDDFDFHIVNFPFLSSNIPSGPSYGVTFRSS